MKRKQPENPKPVKQRPSKRYFVNKTKIVADDPKANPIGESESTVSNRDLIRKIAKERHQLLKELADL